MSKDRTVIQIRLEQLEELLRDYSVELDGFSVDFVENGIILSLIISQLDERGYARTTKTFAFEEDILIDDIMRIVLEKYKLNKGK